MMSKIDNLTIGLGQAFSMHLHTSLGLQRGTEFQSRCTTSLYSHCCCLLNLPVSAENDRGYHNSLFCHYGTRDMQSTSDDRNRFGIKFIDQTMSYGQLVTFIAF